ncbi:hypothetical protein [Massilia sp. erpn]|uniref:hypothetical protein n=1 Tax=Massilia sp. erpn TaxID=2738142 RepID=UPI0021065931|nr:hypothetical protein [Massilia sp. erpn]UTY59611.1 hypothetical protein HPQ68_22005 [Massilia sp. erpn]
MFTNPLSIISDYAKEPLLANATNKASQTRRALRRARDEKIRLFKPYVEEAFKFSALQPVSRRFKIALHGNDALAPLTLIKEHFLTVHMPEPDNRSSDRLFFDNHEIHRSNWRWEADNRTIGWNQSDANGGHAGQITFCLGYWSLAGHIEVAGTGFHATGQAAPAIFDCELSADDIAYHAEDGSLKWDESKWEQATWSSPALRFEFGVECRETGGAKEYRIATTFIDIQTERRWQPRPSYPSDADESPACFVVSISDANRLIFEYIDDGHPPLDNRSDLQKEVDRTVQSVFPWRMELQLDEFATSFKGALVVQGDDGEKHLYAIRGQYPLMSMPLAAHEPVAAHAMAAPLNVVTLLNLDPYVLTDLGVVDDVQRSARKSLDHIIRHHVDDPWRSMFLPPEPLQPDEARIAATPIGAEDPTVFYKKLGIPYLTVSLARADDPEGYAKQLNQERAYSRLRNTMSQSKVYREHLAMLYQFHWRNKFQVTKEYFADENLEVDKKKQEILASMDKAKAFMHERLAGLVNEEDKKNLQEWLDEQLTVGQYAIDNRKYWSWKVFHQVTNLNEINRMLVQVAPGGESAGAARKIQRYSTLLTMLDSSNFFAERYARSMQVFSLLTLLGDQIDLSMKTKMMQKIIDHVIEEYSSSRSGEADARLKVIMEEMRKYNDDKTAQLTDGFAKVFKRFLTLTEEFGTIKRGYFDIKNWRWLKAQEELILGALTQELSEEWQTNPTRWQRAKSAFGNLSDYLSSMAAVVISLFGIAANIYTLATSWNELTDVRKGSLITLGVGQFAYLLALIVKGGLEVRAGWGILRGPGGFFNNLIKKGTLNSSEIEDFYRSGFLKWLARSQTAEGLLAAEQLGARFAARAPAGTKLAAKAVGRFLGRGMLRIVAVINALVLGVVGVITAAIDLANSKEPLQKAMNSMFVIASLLEFAAGLLEVASMATVGTLSVAISVGSCVLSGAAVFFLVIGLVLLIVFLTQHADSPLKKFYQEAAVPVGLARSGTVVINDFSASVAKNDALIERGFVIGDPSLVRVLSLTLDAVSTGTEKGTTATVFDIETNDDDLLRLSTVNLAEDHDAEARLLVWSQKLAALVPIHHDTLDSDHILPTAEIVDGVMDSRGLVERAKVFLYFLINGTRKYLCVTEKGAELVDTATTLAIVRHGCRPAGLSMPDIEYETQNREREVNPVLAIRGFDNEGIIKVTFSLSGALPEFLVFSQEKGNLKQKAPVVAIESRKLSLSASNTLGHTDCQFSISTKAA